MLLRVRKYNKEQQQKKPLKYNLDEKYTGWNQQHKIYRADQQAGEQNMEITRNNKKEKFLKMRIVEGTSATAVSKLTFIVYGSKWKRKRKKEEREKKGQKAYLKK